MNQDRLPLNVTDEGIITQAHFIASPNYDARPEGTAIELLVIHNISLPPGEYVGNGIIQLFRNQLDPDEHPYYRDIYQLRVSAHFLIRRDGELIQFVPCSQRAWHAGQSSWRNQQRCNDFSIGIELEGSDFEAFTEIQYQVLQTLTDTLQANYPIQDIQGHSDIAPGRKTDPGPYFDWQYYRAGLAFRNSQDQP